VKVLMGLERADSCSALGLGFGLWVKGDGVDGDRFLAPIAPTVSLVFPFTLTADINPHRGG
jgi:hypothetical protein